MQRVFRPSTGPAPARYARRHPSPASCIRMDRWQACAFWYTRFARRSGTWCASNASAAPLLRVSPTLRSRAQGGWSRQRRATNAERIRKSSLRRRTPEVFADDLATLALTYWLMRRAGGGPRLTRAKKRSVSSCSNATSARFTVTGSSFAIQRRGARWAAAWSSTPSRPSAADGGRNGLSRSPH
jgi:hypothetical protein